MAADIALTEAQRSNIATLRDVQELSDRTQNRLSTGRQVNNVVDDAVAFFTSKALYDRADDFLERKDYIEQGVSTLQAALDATEAIDDLLDQMKGIAEAAKSQSTAERQSSTEQFNELGTQISQLVEDAEYNGYNLLSDTNNELDIRFSDRTASRIVVGGFDLNSTSAGTTDDALRSQLFSNVAFNASVDNNTFKGLSVVMSGEETSSFTALGANNSALAVVEYAISNLDDAINRLRAVASDLGSNVSILTTRVDFTEDYTEVLNTGGDKLTLADMNEEGANLTALQTRQELGIQSLAISGDQQRSVLSLLQ